MYINEATKLYTVELLITICHHILCTISVIVKANALTETGTVMKNLLLCFELH